MTPLHLRVEQAGRRADLIYLEPLPLFDAAGRPMN